MDVKQYAVKMTSANEQGLFTGHASAFGNVDLEGDIIEPGAFTSTLADGHVIKLLAQHDMARPIGKVIKATEDSKGLRVEGYISPTAEGRDYRQLVKDGVINEMSIGYVPVKTSVDDRGIRHLWEVELKEISLVSNPANPAATIQEYKSEGGKPMSNISELSVEQLQETIAQATVAAVQAALGGAQKSEDDPPVSPPAPGADPEDDPADQKSTSSGGDGEVKAASAAREIQRKYAGIYLPTPANSMPKKALPPGINWARYQKCMLRASGDPERAAEIAYKSYGDDDMRREIKALTAASPTDGGFLVPETYASEVIPLLYAQAIVMKLGATKLEMDSGSMNIPKVGSGATAEYTGEARRGKKSGATFKNVRLSAKKLMTKVPISNDLIRSNAYSADQIVLKDAVKAMALRMDKAALVGSGTEFEPKGLYSMSEIPRITLDAEPNEKTTGKMLGELIRREADTSKLGWAMNGLAWEAFFNVVNQMGLYIYREQMDSERKLSGHEFAISNQIPTKNEKTSIILGDWSEFIIGEQMDMQSEMFREGSILDDEGNTLSALDNDLTILRIISLHDFAVRHPESFVIADGIQI